MRSGRPVNKRIGRDEEGIGLDRRDLCEGCVKIAFSSGRDNLQSEPHPVRCLLQRNLVYTGVTRGKRLVGLLGQRRALAIAIKGARARKR